MTAVGVVKPQTRSAKGEGSGRRQREGESTTAGRDLTSRSLSLSGRVQASRSLRPARPPVLPTAATAAPDPRHASEGSNRCPCGGTRNPSPHSPLPNFQYSSIFSDGSFENKHRCVAKPSVLITLGCHSVVLSARLLVYSILERWEEEVQTVGTQFSESSPSIVAES